MACCQPAVYCGDSLKLASDGRVRYNLNAGSNPALRIERKLTIYIEPPTKAFGNIAGNMVVRCV